MKIIEKFCLEKSGERNSGHGGKWHINLTEGRRFYRKKSATTEILYVTPYIVFVVS